MTANNDDGPGVDSGAAIYADSTLDYLDTGRDHMTRLAVAPESSRDAPLAAEPTGGGVVPFEDELVEAFQGAYALVVEVGESGQLRRRLVMSLAAAERARRRAEDRGQHCRVALVRLQLVAELARAPRAGGEAQCPG